MYHNKVEMSTSCDTLAHPQRINALISTCIIHVLAFAALITHLQHLK